MEKRTRIPTWIFVVLGVIAIIAYNKHQNRQVSALIGKAQENHIVYSGPNVKDFDEIGTLPADTDVILKGRNGSSWVTFSYKGQQGWIQEFFLDIDGNVMRLPEVENITLPTVSISKEDRVKSYFQSIVSDDRYDSNKLNLHKYLDYLEINIKNNELSFYLKKSPDSYEDFFYLASTLIFGSSLLSDAGGKTDWNLSRIEVISPPAAGDYGSLFVSGHQDIVSIVDDSSTIYDLMQIGFDYGDTASSSTSNFGTSKNWNEELAMSQGIEIGCPSGCTYHKEGCDIKGNVAFESGEKIYHMPNQEFYSETKINTAYGERWFCTEEEALSNGWRKSFE